MNADLIKRLSVILLILFFIPSLLNAELLPELRREVIAFIHSPYLEFPEGHSEPLPLSSVTINSQALTDAFERWQVESVQKGFPECSDDDTLAVNDYGITVKIPQFSRVFRLFLINENEVDSLMQELSQLDIEVLYAEKNGEAELQSILGEIIPNDPHFFTQWHLKNTGQEIQTQYGIPDCDIRATYAWDIFTGTATRVGVFDAGVHYHDDLYAYGDRPSGTYDHGTCVAGIIGARTNNGLGIAGINWHAELYSYKIYDPGWLGDVNAAWKIKHAIDHDNVRILNHSWALPMDDISFTLMLAFSYAYKMNCVSGVSMNNGSMGCPSFPANWFEGGVIAVGSIHNRCLLPDFTGVGWCLDVVAPGAGIKTTTYYNNWGGYYWFGGNSAAAPMVTGLASLLKGYKPSLYNDDIEKIIHVSAVDLREPGWDSFTGWGRINARRALELARSPYSFTYLDYTGGGVYGTPYYGNIWTHGVPGLADNVYFAYRYAVRNYVTIPAYYSRHIWGVGNRTTGFNDNMTHQFGIGNTKVINYTSTSACLETYVYRVYSWPFPTVEYGWFPCKNDEVLFSLCVHGLDKGGGCPWIFVNTHDSTNFMADNNILHRSEFAEFSGVDVVDLYKLNVVPANIDSVLEISIIETEQDHNYFDKIKLIAVDHPTGTFIGITENNDIVMYDSLAVNSSDSAMLNSTLDITDRIRYNQYGARIVQGVQNDSIYAHYDSSMQMGALNYVRNKYAKLFGLDNSGDSLALIGEISAPDGELPPEAKVFCGTAIIYTNSETYQEQFARREQSSVVIIPFGPVSDVVDHVDFDWNRDYSVSYFCVAPIIYSGFTITEVPMVSAVHSSLGDVLSDLQSVDSNYAEIDTSSMLDLKFSNISPPQQGLVRDYIFETNGRYTTPGGFYQPLLKDKVSKTIPFNNKLHVNYPNPFNPKTTIKFDINKNSLVKLRIYNILGQMVTELVNEFKTPGNYSVEFDGTSLASGVYFYRIEAGTFVETRKMVLIK